MDLLYYDILEYIISYYLLIDDTYSIVQLNKWYFNNIKELFTNLKLKFIGQLYQKFPIFIIKLFINGFKMNYFKKLEFQDNFYGLTGDLDQIKFTDLNNSIMYSQDRNFNFFIMLKLKIKIDDKILNNCITIYQKTILNYRWCINSINSYYRIFFNQIIESSDIDKLKLILNNQILKINNSSLWIEY